MYKQRTVEDNGPGAETSNTIVLDVGKAQMYTISSAPRRSNPGENNLKLVVVVVSREDFLSLKSCLKLRMLQQQY